MNADHRCLLCRRQRRRCDGRNCEFGQYFPGHMPDEFENAYRLFGLNNLLNIMRSVEPHQRQAAADSILAEGTSWRNDPVHGSLGYELNLRSQIISSLRELEAVNQLLAFFRDQATKANPPTMQIPPHTHRISLPNQPQTAGHVAGIDRVQPYKRESFHSSHEKGESSSTVASKEKMIVEEKESEAHDKGKRIIVDDDRQLKEAAEKGENITSEEDKEAQN
ncbi:LOB domain-containing protein 22-like [Gastrolobium bilobum]|uniref:LOB domain-containing protein 22-like n=1 Tax=Gastrolobium bilobum TaxID=150636 RepID=UPI002AB21E93|nr:LOB domain-containing protein 22-like [Gastrolobium bilobum]